MKIKRVISFVLAAGMLITLLASCTGSGGKDDDDEGTDYVNIADYKVIRSDLSNASFIDNVSTFKKLLSEYTGAELSVGIDADTEPSAKEILIGQTSRPESQSALTELEAESDDGAYIIRETNGKILILGKTDAATLRAMKYFLMTYAKTSKESNTLTFSAGHSETGKVDLSSQFFDETFTELITEHTVDIAIPSDPNGKQYYAYETLVEIRHNPNEKLNGTLLCSYANYFASNNGYKIYKSTDKGDTWEHISTAIDTYTNFNSLDSNLQPYLFELPADVGNFKKGTLILAACTRGTYARGSVSAITLYYSVDCGETWKAYCNVAKGGNADEWTGVWEPFLAYDDATGRVYCYYSDETGEKAGPKSQKLTYKYSTDMINWSEAVEFVKTDNPNERPGMISITKMGNGKYFMVYEMAGDKSRVYARISDSLDDWGDPKDHGTPIYSLEGKSIGSAPWCAWTPVGGECGMLFIAARMMSSGTSKTGTDMLVSFDYGKTFTAIDNLIPYRTIETDHCGYSTYIGFTDGGSTMFYMNNPDISDTSSKVVFSRIKVW